jgi:hypothetical protein
MSAFDETVDALKDDLGSATWSDRIVTVLLSVGLLAFGVALGVRWAAVSTFNEMGPISATTPRPIIISLSQVYNGHMRLMLAVSAVGLIGALLLDKFSSDPE